MSEIVPEGWSLKILGDLSKVKRGASPRPIQDPKWWGGTVGWTRISDVTSSKKYLTKTTDYLSNEGVRKSVQIPKGEVILSICATIGRPIIVKTDVCIHDGFVWFEGLKLTINREFYYYFLSSKEEILTSSKQTGTQGNLNTEIVSRLPILLPPLPEQNKIASILTSVDEVIENTQKQIDKLQDLKKATMNELLTKGIGHTQFKDSELGRIPQSWEVVELRENLDFISYGFTNPMPESKLGNVMVTAKDVKNGVIDYKNARKTTSKAFETLLTEKSRPKIGDILLTKDGTLGRVAVVDRSGICINQSVAVLRPNSKVSSLFLFFLLASSSYQKTILENAGGSTIKHIYITIVDKMKVAIPQKEEQENIVIALVKINNHLQGIHQKLQQTQSLKKSLMQDLLTGKVRVTV